MPILMAWYTNLPSGEKEGKFAMEDDKFSDLSFLSASIQSVLSR